MIGNLFKNIDKWRGFPNWHIRPFLDVLFGIYLEELLGCNGIKNIEMIVPAFPLRHGDMYDGIRSNRSSLVDYAVFTERTLYLIDIDIGEAGLFSKKRKIYDAACKVGAHTILNGLVLISENSHAQKKYEVLLDELCTIGVMEKGEQQYQPSHKIKSIEVVSIVADTCTDSIGEIVIPFSKIIENCTFDDPLSIGFKDILKLYVK
ncbi:MAG: hypothetical protein OCC49_10200 [Fibrobacterales bacterium]